MNAFKSTPGPSWGEDIFGLLPSFVVFSYIGVGSRINGIRLDVNLTDFLYMGG